MIAMMLAGALIGLGAWLGTRALLPAPPSLEAALRPLSDPAAAELAEGSDWRDRAGRWLAHRVAGTALDLRIPRTDLALLGKTVESYLAQKLTLTCVGLIAPTLVWLLIQPPFGWLISVGYTLAFTAYLFIAPDVAIRSQAADARADFRAALIAYLELIGLASAAGKGPSEALEAPARIGHGWVFERLASILDPARRGTRDTWDELERLSEEINVPELADIAVISRRAGVRGAKILESLRAKAASLRDQEHAAALARAKSRTETMTVPMVLTVIGFLILLGYPAFARIGAG